MQTASLGAIPWPAALASIVPFLSFAWAVPAHFARDGSIPVGMRTLSAFSLVSYTCFWLLLGMGHAPAERSLIEFGVLAFVTATVLFWWAVFTTRDRRLRLAHSVKQSEFIQVAGPYARIRHPFYTAYIVFWLGTACVAEGWQWLPVAILVVWYLALARSEERRFETSGLSASYRAYRGQAGMILPRLRRR